MNSLKQNLKKELVEGEKNILGHVNEYDYSEFETDLDFGIKLA